MEGDADRGAEDDANGGLEVYVKGYAESDAEGGVECEVDGV